MTTPPDADSLLVDRIRRGETQAWDDLIARYYLPRRPLPVGRLGRPEDLASIVAFLASERASWISGAYINVDGGWVKSIY